MIDSNSIPNQEPSPGVEAPLRMVDERMELLQQVLSSRTFAKSVRLARFLEFICLRTIEGNSRELNEQQIGIHVFARSPAYSASDDSIVRTQARLLRQRLEEYFEHECPTCPVVISIPKGGYVPIFEPRNNAPKAPVPAPGSSTKTDESQVSSSVLGSREQTPADRKHGRRWIYGATAAGGTAVLLGLLAFYFWFGSRNQGPSEALWSSIFNSGRSVVIVPSDDALVLFEELTQAAVPLDEYLSGSYLEKSNLPHAGTTTLTSDWFAAHQYTSSADLNLAMRLSRLPEAGKAKVEARNARVLRIDDLKSNNVILIGGIGANPWVGLFSDRLNFDVNYDWKSSEGYVLNKHPAKGEAPIYRDAISADGTRRSYGVLAFLPGIEDNGQALLFEGTGMAGTEAAADFPFNPISFRSFAQQIGATSGKTPYFEALIETTSIAGNAPEARLVGYRLIKP
ncbi:hypothetical protein [Edaphobacter dinghuensis]|nr:hypothetical protein [Edaphobacter dinghuensis]